MLQQTQAEEMKALSQEGKDKYMNDLVFYHQKEQSKEQINFFEEQSEEQDRFFEEYAEMTGGRRSADQVEADQLAEHLEERDRAQAVQREVAEWS